MRQRKSDVIVLNFIAFLSLSCQSRAHLNSRSGDEMAECLRSQRSKRSSKQPKWEPLSHSFWILDWCLSRRRPSVPLVKTSQGLRVSHETPVSRPPKCRGSAGLRCYTGFSQVVLSGNACNLQRNKLSIRKNGVNNFIWRIIY